MFPILHAGAEREEVVEAIAEKIQAIEEKRVEKTAKRPPFAPKCYGPSKDCLKGMEDCAAANCMDDAAAGESPGTVCATKKDGTGMYVAHDNKRNDKQVRKPKPSYY